MPKEKIKYMVFDKYLQDWLYAYAYSKSQAKVLLRNQALERNGKFKFISNILKAGLK